MCCELFIFAVISGVHVGTATSPLLYRDLPNVSVLVVSAKCLDFSGVC